MSKKSSKNAEVEDVLEVVHDLRDLMVHGFGETNKQFDHLEKHLDKHDKNFDHIYNLLDAHMKRIEDILQENAMRDHKQDRMEKWILQIADKVGVKLKYD